jgi:Flp pilus assembly pilin Flp
MQHPKDVTRRFLADESGLSKLEWVGLIAFIGSLLYMVGPIRELIVNTIGIVFDQTAPATGEISDFSTAMRGIAIVGGAVIVFIGSGWLLLWTNLGRSLASLLTGAATFGWLTINGILFVVYAPRGIRPNDLEGLNAFQMRLPAIAMTLGAFILFLMFTIALSRYESENAEA